jgi:uncharacterized protein YcbX
MELAEVVGQLAGLRRFPVRSLGGEEPDEVLMQGSAMAGDRIYDLMDEEQGEALSPATAPRLLRYRARYLDAICPTGAPSKKTAGSGATSGSATSCSRSSGRATAAW